MSEQKKKSSVAVKGRYEKKKPKELPFTKKQKRTLDRYNLVITLEIVVIIVLVVLRWFVGGWWITWNTGSTSGNEANSNKDDTSTQETVMGDFNAPEFDPNAVVGVPTVDENLGWAVLDISEGYSVHVCGILNADASGSLPVWFASDADNTVWVKLRLLDADGNVLGETGILKPGEYVERMQLVEGTHSCAVTLQVMGYEPETYYSAGSVGLATNLIVPN